MKEYAIIFTIGLIAGAADSLPLSKDNALIKIRNSLINYLLITFLVLATDFSFFPWFLKGGVFAFAFATPQIGKALIYRDRSVTFITGKAIVLGTIISVAGFFLI